MKKALSLATLLLFFTSFPLIGQKRISTLIEKPGDLSSDPKNFIELGSKYLFTADHPIFGTELWVTDGTENGTTLLKDINHTEETSLHSFDLKGVVKTNGLLYFIADDGVNGNQIWQTDGTTNGTTMVSILNDFNANHLTLVDDKLFFSQPSTGGGFELWRYDLTTAKYDFIKDISDTHGSHFNTGAYLGLYFFTSQQLVTGKTKLWRSDGTDQGTFPVASELEGIGIGENASKVSQFTEIGGDLYLVVTSNDQTSILKTDGSISGTSKNHLPLPSRFRFFDYGESFAINDQAYFSFYTDQTNDFYIYSVHNQSQSALPIFSGKSMIPSNVVHKHGKLIFLGSNNANSVDLMQVDLSSSNTSTIASLESTVTTRSYDHSFRGYLTATTDDQVLISYIADGFTPKTHLYHHNTNSLTNANIGFHPELIRTQFGVLYSDSFQLGGPELWVAGPGFDNAHQLMNIVEQKRGLRDNTHFISTGDEIVFYGEDQISGLEPRVYNEITETLSVLHEILPGAQSNLGALDLFISNGFYHYYAMNSSGEMAMFRTDGTPGNISEILTFPNATEDWPLHTTTYKGNLYLSTYSSLKKLEGSNLTQIKSFELPDQSSQISVFGLYPSEGVLFIQSGLNIFAFDGQSESMVELPDTGLSKQFLVIGKTLYFTKILEDGTAELWGSDGTVTGTLKIKELGKTEIQKLTAFGNRFVFDAATEDNGRELWISDGTKTGTFMINDIYSGEMSSLTDPDFAVLGKDLFFSANNGIDGMELWKTDGTAAGTQIVHDLAPGITSSKPRFLHTYNGKVYFTAYTPQAGNELWETDGTASGTKQTFDLITGSESSLAKAVLHTDRYLYFVARSDEFGNQLWQLSDVVTGIEDEAYDKSITIYPNPAQNILNIRFSSSPLDTQLEIIDINSQQLQFTKLDESTDQSVDISGLTTGIYFIKLVSKDHKVSIKKIMITQ